MNAFEESFQQTIADLRLLAMSGGDASFYRNLADRIRDLDPGVSVSSMQARDALVEVVKAEAKMRGT